MSNPDYIVSPEQVAQIANELFVGSLLPLPGPDSPPGVVPVAPRGGGASAGSAPGVGAGTPPGVVPVAPRGGGASAPIGIPGLDAPLTGLAPSNRYLGGALPQPATSVPPSAPQGSPYAVPADGPYARTATRAPEVPTGAFGPTPVRDVSTRDTFDVGSVREDFPILSEQVNGHPLIWFDNAATTQKPRQVIERISSFYEHENSNIHRAAHELAARATDAYEDTRSTVQRFLGAARSEEIIFTRGTTEAINLVAQSWGRANLGPGDEILLTNLEHHANIVPWQIVADRTGASIVVAPVDNRGQLDEQRFGELLNPRTKIASFTQVANATGTVNPVVSMAHAARRAGARVLVDGAQSVPHLAVDLSELDADFFVFSGHKIFGPTGIGSVFIRERVWDETPAWQGGGNMIADVTFERSIYQPPPNKYEAGTGNIADAVGLAEALRYVERIGLHRIAAYEHDLLEYATPRLAAIPGVTLVGTADHKASVLSFVLAGHEPHEVGTALNEKGIAVRAGHHCAQPILRRLGYEATVRPSFAFYNTYDEIDFFIETVRQIAGA